MSRWLRRIYNAVASFNLSNALLATGLGGMDRRGQHLRESSDKRNQHVESRQSGEPNKFDDSTGRACGAATSRDSVIIGNDVIITDSREICDTECNKCHPVFCDHIERDYNEYTSYTASVRTEGQGLSSRIRLSDEPRSFKQPNPDAARTNIESVTGIPTGVTI